MTAPDTVSHRIRAEYLEMPGMSLTIQQIARLCGIERSACHAVLDALVEAKFLAVKPDGTYARRTEEVGHIRMAKTRVHVTPRINRGTI
jgi:DNA-binding IclR family transcriptional regulator